jgi:hypothetical protein
MKRIFQAIAQAAGKTAKAAADVAYSPAVQGKVAQGATELANALFTGHAYSPYTAENSARRAQFQAKEQSQAAEH